MRFLLPGMNVSLFLYCFSSLSLLTISPNLFQSHWASSHPGLFFPSNFVLLHNAHVLLHPALVFMGFIKAFCWLFIFDKETHVQICLSQRGRACGWLMFSVTRFLSCFPNNLLYTDMGTLRKWLFRKTAFDVKLATEHGSLGYIVLKIKCGEGGGRGESRWGIQVNPWLIHVNVRQNQLQYRKVISLQLIKINEIK